MSRPNKKKNQDELVFLESLKLAFKIIFAALLIWLVKWIYFDIYKPEEKRYIRNSRYVYEILQDELTKYYKEKGYVYDGSEAIDEFCERIRVKYSPLYGTCAIKNEVSDDVSIYFKSKNITVSGFNRPPIKVGDVYVKDIIIDVDGNKGENTFGIDRVPLRIYSSGRMGGLLSPVNCNKGDMDDFGIPYSPICPTGVNINFMDIKIPFSYDIIQIGGKDGKSTRLNQNVSFLRADCLAFGAEITGADEYCDKRSYYWLTACYHDYYCAIQFHKD